MLEPFMITVFIGHSYFGSLIRISNLVLRHSPLYSLPQFHLSLNGLAPCPRPFASIPEVAGLDGSRGLVRIPPELDVPLTPRVRQIIDTAEFRRLARISQLGLVSLVYPAAIHTRFEH